MKNFWKYLAGVLFGIGIGILGTYYTGISGQYLVAHPWPLTLLAIVISLNFMIIGIVIALWRRRKDKRAQ
ncbi:MAG: hypothetical protein PHQ27_06820 [Victivallales bacterium]|nr:hypothetical protein [Victivallales bacterium]